METSSETRVVKDQQRLEPRQAFDQRDTEDRLTPKLKSRKKCD